MPADQSDPYHLLLDRLWALGVVKKDLEVDTRNKDVAPSSVLRRWFRHDPKKWLTFPMRYLEELIHLRLAIRLQAERICGRFTNTANLSL